VKTNQYSSHEERQVYFAFILTIVTIAGLIIGVSIYMVSEIQQKKRMEDFNSRRDAAAAKAATNNANSLNPDFLLNAGSMNAQTNSN
jgi:hypothetical protein